MKNYLIHIGLPKTGTTALQKECFDHLNQSSMCYNPSIIFQSLTEMLKLIDFDMETKEDIRLLKDVIAYEETKISQNNILISHEILAQRLGKFDYRKRANFLKSIFPNATIVLVLRYQPALLRSLYLQFLRQNYWLKHDEVFTKHVFLDTEQWRTNMLIDVKQWNYTEAVRCFKSLYGKKLHVFFYESFPNLIDLGKEILAIENMETCAKNMNALPKINVSYDAKIIRFMFFICSFRIAFKANRGIKSRHVEDLIHQAKQARFNFDAEGVDSFLHRLKNPRHISRELYSSLDTLLLKALTKLQRIPIFFKHTEYKLPSSVMEQLEYDAKTMNASLHEVIDSKLIPKQYV